MEVLSPLDAAFLRLEDRSTSLHIASVAVFDGPAPDFEEFTAAYGAKLPLVPRYLQRAVEVPLRLGRPVWVDDPHFSLRYHLRHTALPRPGSDRQLRDLVGRLMSQQLDRGKPLWETWLVDGLHDGRWALVSKVHHCMVDGVAGTDVASLLLDTSPDPAPEPPPAEQARPTSLPGSGRLLLSAVTAVPHRPAALAAWAARAARSPRRTAADAALVAHGALAFAGLARPAAASSLTGPLTPHRDWGWTSASLADVRTMRRALGGTVNDVVLTAITRGFRDLLVSRGEVPDAAAVRTLVPVSVRHADQHGRLDNRVSAMVAQLPVDVVEPDARLLAVREELDRLKTSGEPQFAELFTAAGVVVPGPVLALGLTGAFRLPHRNLVTVTTNVPGPPVPLYACGRRMCEYYPYVPIADRVRIGVAITSYDGVLGFGVTADADSTPDLQVLLDGIDAEMAELLELSGVSHVVDLRSAEEARTPTSGAAAP